MKKIGWSLLSLVLSASVGAVEMPAETQEVQALMAPLVVDKSFKYCMKGTLTCREMVLLKDKTTAQPTVQIMYNNFVSSERSVAATGYFLKNADGTYRILEDSTFDGAINIDLLPPLNQALRVTFDTDGLPTLHDVTLKRLGTTRKILATMSYSATQSTIVGVETDDADPSYQKQINTVYLRIVQ